MKLEPILTPISKRDDQDSYVYDLHLPTKRQAVKIYSNLEPEFLEAYARIQNKLSQHDLEVDLESVNVTFERQKLQKLVISLLQIPLVAYPASFIGDGRNKGKPVYITTPDYVPGKRLDWYLDNNLGSKPVIEGLIGRFLETIATEEDLYYLDQTYENMKVTSFDGGTLTIVITDISNDIFDIVIKNSELCQI